MKVRVTGLLLGLLVLVAVMVPAFAAVVDKTETIVSDVSEEPEITVDVQINAENVEVGHNQPTILVPHGTKITLGAEGANEPTFNCAEVKPMSDSPYYLNSKQLTELVYQEIDGVNYVTAASFLIAMNPETAVEESRGVVNASAVTVTGVEDLNGDNMADLKEETLVFRAQNGANYVMANGRYLYVKQGVKSIEGQVAIPVDVFAKVFNLKVNYQDELILLARAEGSAAYLEKGSSYYNEYTLYWLSHIINAESGNQPLAGKIAVGNVVMNRVRSAGFPNNIKDVLFQRNQFTPAMSGSIYCDPNEESVIAAKLVMDGAVVLRYALFFNRAGMNTFAARNRPYVTTIGAHSFYN